MYTFIGVVLLILVYVITHVFLFFQKDMSDLDEELIVGIAATLTGIDIIAGIALFIWGIFANDIKVLIGLILIGLSIMVIVSLVNDEGIIYAYLEHRKSIQNEVDEDV